MTEPGELLQVNPELNQANEEFVSALVQRAPELQYGLPAYYSERPDIKRSVYEPRYNCRVIPQDDVTKPPVVVLIYGESAISHQRQVFKYRESTGQYWKQVIDAEPMTVETMPPNETYHEPTPVTAMELGKVLGIMEFLVKRERSTLAAADSPAKANLGKRLLSLLK